MELSDDQRERVLRAARGGANWTTCAHLVGVCRTTFWAYRKQNPEFDAALAKALAEWDWAMTRKQNLAVRAGEFDDAMTLFQLRAKRLPERYSPDPKMRVGSDDMMEDLTEASAVPAGTGFEDAVQVLLDARKEGKL